MLYHSQFNANSNNQAFDTPTPPLAILDFYGAKQFSDAHWTQHMPGMPDHCYDPRPQAEIDQLHGEQTTFIGGVSLEGHSADPSAPNPMARQAFAMHQIAMGQVVKAIWAPYPNELEKIDPLLNVSGSWPPVAIVHGTADVMIPMRLSRDLEGKLRECGVETEFIEVADEPHTFCGKMVKGSKTWDMQRKGFDFLEKVIARSY